MADTTIPPPDAAGYWHFTYITTDLVDGSWYGGKRSTKKHPDADRYLGSGNWIRAHPARERLTRRIVAFFGSSAEVYTAEAVMIPCAVVMDDALCMNECGGGDGFTIEDRRRMHADPEFQAAHLAGVLRNGARPEFAAAASKRITQSWRDPDYREKMLAAIQLRAIRYPISPERIEGMVVKTRGRKRCPIAVEKGAAKLRGQRRTPEMKARIGAALVLARVDETQEYRAQIGAHLLASRQTPKARGNIKAAAQRREAAKRAARAL